MPTFLACLSTTSNDDHPLTKGDKYDPGCPFCNVSVEKGFAVVYESPDLIAFKDRSPQAETHLLIIPRQHSVPTVKHLTTDHIPLLNRMSALADELVPDKRKTGFHIPPFSSVHHLHLHVLAGRPTLLGRFKYPERGGRTTKGWSWFITPQQAIAILDNGGKIGLGSSRV